MNTICVNPGWPKQVIPVYKDGLFSFPEGFPPVEKVVETARRLGLGVNHPLGVMLYQHLVRTTVAALKMGALNPGRNGQHPGLQPQLRHLLRQIESINGNRALQRHLLPSARSLCPAHHGLWIQAVRRVDRRHETLGSNILRKRMARILVLPDRRTASNPRIDAPGGHDGDSGGGGGGGCDDHLQRTHRFRTR